MRGSNGPKTKQDRSLTPEITSAANCGCRDGYATPKNGLIEPRFIAMLTDWRSTWGMSVYMENEMSVPVNKSLFTSCLALAGLFLAAPVLAQENINRSIDDFEWNEVMPGLSVSVLWEVDPNGDNAFMAKIPAGGALPRHSHTASYHGIVVQGNWIHSNEKGEDFSLMPGSYFYQVGEIDHGDRCEGEIDCLLFVHRHAAGDFIPEA